MFLLGGCAAPPKQPIGPTQMRLQIDDRDTFLDQAMTTLRELDFQPARLDREKGELVTQPTTSGQWFEFWRRDVRGGYQFWEANLQTMRRAVTVQLTPQSTSNEVEAESRPAEYVLAVRVDKAKFSAPERQITTASGALGIYSQRVPTESGLRGPAGGAGQWIPVGRDEELEKYMIGLLAKHALEVLGGIEAPAQQPTSADSDTTEN